MCDISSSHDSSASFFENNSRHGDGSGADILVQNAIFSKNVDKAVFGSHLMKMKQETRSLSRRVLSKEETNFNLLMDLGFRDLPRKKYQLASLVEAVVK